MPLSKPSATKTVSALVALAVILSVVAVGGVAQTDSQDSDASAEDAEPNDSMANATPIEYSEEIDANLSSHDDVDYYAVNATAGDGLLPRLHLKNMFEGSAIAVDIVAPNGEVTTELTNDQIHGPQNVAGEARPVGARDTAYTGDVMESNGTYYVRVQESQYSRTDDTATYEYNLTVTTEDLDQYDPNENGANASTLEIGTPTEATMTGYDNEVYAVNLTAGQTYNVSVDSDGNIEKQVNVFDNASLATDEDDYQNDGAIAELEHNNFIDDATLTFTVEENGTYYVELAESNVNPSLLDRSNYTITVSESTSAPVDDGPGPLPDDGDADSDGLTNAREEQLGTNPRDADSDNDSLSDGREVNEFGTDPTDADTDDDGLDDDCELKHDMDPTNPDTDGDGTLDGDEV